MIAPFTQLVKGSLPGLCYRRLTSPFHLTEGLTTTTNRLSNRTGAGMREPEG